MSEGAGRGLDRRRQGAVEHVRLDRPELRKAFDERLVRELTDWAEEAATDPSLKVAVLSGEGKSFCAGADLEWMSRTADYTEEQYREDAAAVGRMYEALDRLPQVLIGRVYGAAIAGGAGLASVCDIVVAAEDSLFGFSEVKRGIIPAMIAPYVVAKIGASAARELFLARRGASQEARAGVAGFLEKRRPPCARWPHERSES